MKPARAEVPAALGTCPQIAINFRGRSIGTFRRQHVLAVGFLARDIPVIPVAVENCAVGKAHHPTVGAAGGQRIAALHPEIIFPAQGGQKLSIDSTLVACTVGNQINHGSEEGRLRAAQIVAAVAVRHMAIAVDQACEIADHAEDQIVTAALLETEHREIRVPIVDLIKAPARNNIGFRERQAGRIGTDLLGLALEQGPERVNMAAHVLVPIAIAAAPIRSGNPRISGNGEMPVDESGEVKARPALLLPIPLVNGRWCVILRQSIDERLAITKDALHLHVLEQLAVEFPRTLDFRTACDGAMLRDSTAGGPAQPARTASAASADAKRRSPQAEHVLFSLILRLLLSAIERAMGVFPRSVALAPV